MSGTTTRGIRIEVESIYIEERSSPENNQFFFAYRVRIVNESKVTAQLMSRHWTITDSDGRTQEVRGPGVVGKQPILEPGEAFEYSSFCPLETSFGTMHGSYEMVAADGRRFAVEIPPFALGQPHSIN